RRLNSLDDVNLLRVMDAAMIVTKRVEATIGRMFIGVNDSARQHPLLNERLKRICVDVRNHSRDNMALTLYRSSHDGFVFAGCAAFFPASAITANIGFVNLNTTAQWFVVLFKHLANLFEHAPRGFVGDSGFALKLFGRDAATSRSH